MRNFITLFAAVMAYIPLVQADMITKQSMHSVAVTMDRLEAAAKEKGAGIAARVNHAAAAAKVDMSLRPTEVLIFGNPKLGTPMMQSNPRAGLDLPLKVVAWEDASGKVWVAYDDPADIAKKHGVGDRAETVQKMTGILDQLTNQATKP